MLDYFTDGGYAKYNEELGLVFVWFGGHRVHIYTESGEEIECCTRGDLTRNSMTLDEAVQTVDEVIADSREEYERSMAI
ncbi:hypothetical protein [Mahella australiensis]|uniref:Uncharacterized protein n=1 Tax=Mahella australiensis (strain DSM 15567 / CIP 107919 / 50-1 BON) TaxID=697281 RepID=F3ZXG3_MAHA5|nr:hypothetical protein [Mahella australiensis]AEE97644.1 hypothetical protein Mahau_2486 [Mahella australiensis 50-1 BON]